MQPHFCRMIEQECEKIKIKMIISLCIWLLEECGREEWRRAACKADADVLLGRVMKQWVCNHTMRREQVQCYLCIEGRAEGLKHQSSFSREIGCSLKISSRRRVRVIFPLVFCSLACSSLMEETKNLWRSHDTVLFFCSYWIWLT